MYRTRFILTIALLLTLFAGAFLSAPASAVGETETTQGYTIQLVSKEVSGDTSAWIYAVTATGDVDKGLSHITFGVETACDYLVLAPATGFYTTLTDIPYCSTSGINCQTADYQVELGYDPTTAVSGVKFNAASNPLDRDNRKTHIFQIQLKKDGDHITGMIPLGLKIATQNIAIQIQGGICRTTAVQLSGLSARSTGSNALIWLIPAAPLAMVWAARRLRRKSI